MFIVTLTYKVALAEIDAHLAAHRIFLDRHFASGAFLASGPREPRTGGVILATIADRQALEHILEEDPFWRLDLARYDIEEFRPTRFADTLPEKFRNRLSSGS
jgi:uncharacterized protein YciI